MSLSQRLRAATVLCDALALAHRQMQALYNETWVPSDARPTAADRIGEAAAELLWCWRELDIVRGKLEDMQ